MLRLSRRHNRGAYPSPIVYLGSAGGGGGVGGGVATRRPAARALPRPDISAPAPVLRASWACVSVLRPKSSAFFWGTKRAPITGPH